METGFDAFTGEWDEETSGALIRRSSKVKTGRNLKENVKNETFKMETEADEVPSLISNVEVVENTVENEKENCSCGEAKTGMTKEAELSEITCVQETVSHENEELLEPGGSSEKNFSMISSNDSAVTTTPDETQPKAKSDWSVYFAKEEGYECRDVLDEEGEVIDYENKDTELVKDEKVIQTMTEVNENQTSVSEIITHNSQNGFVKAQNETRLSDHWSRTLENSASTGKVEEIVRVLKEQQSHDLLCPACGSCITKRVILRKRKRISTVSVDRWIQTPDDDAQAALLEGGQQITEDENGQPEISHEDSDETEAYGCLACFSIFFRRVVGVQHLLAKSESVQESLADQDPSSVLQDTRDISNKEKESFYWLPFQNPWRKNSKKEPRPDEQLKEPLLTKGKLEKNVSMLPDGSVSHDILQSDDKESEGTSPLLSDRVESSGLLTKRDPTPLHFEKTAISTDVTVTAVQTVIEVEPIDDSQPYDVATTVPESTRTTTTEPQARQIVTEWDVLKSIVYGGLTVSLTSLGVVSSTAGGDAKTLTVIAIGLSNLVAGLFVILNNIVDLDHYHKDQFIARVGHSSWFNGSLAIVSYLIFGSLAAITYAFSFRKSDDRLYKFIATSAVSMVCIILLALGKARISKKSYIRTVTLYIVTGFWSAVAGFFAGEYIKKLLEKWGFKTD